MYIFFLTQLFLLTQLICLFNITFCLKPTSHTHFCGFKKKTLTSFFLCHTYFVTQRADMSAYCLYYTT